MKFEDYVDTHGTRLMRLATVMCADPYEAEDVVQEALLRVYARWDRISIMTYPHAYVRRTVMNEAMSIRRKWGRVEARPTDQLDFEVIDRTTVTDERAALVASIGSLPPKQRAAVVLRYFEDLTDREIAQTLACRTTTVRGYIYRALKTLRIDLSADAGLVFNEGRPR